MEFYISRTSEWGDKKPHERAYRSNYTRIDSRNVSNPEKLNHKSDRENWYKEGINHRVENGCIKRDFQNEGWFIDISSLEELIELQQEAGDIILQNFMWNEEILEIEIYDTYRE